MDTDGRYLRVVLRSSSPVEADTLFGQFADWGDKSEEGETEGETIYHLFRVSRQAVEEWCRKAKESGIIDDFEVSVKRDEETEEDLLFLANNKLMQMGFSVQETGDAIYPRVYRFPEQQRDYVAADLDSVLALADVAHILLRSSTQGLTEKATDDIVSAIHSSSSPLDPRKREEVKTLLVNLLIDVQKRDG